MSDPTPLPPRRPFEDRAETSRDRAARILMESTGMHRFPPPEPPYNPLEAESKPLDDLSRMSVDAVLKQHDETIAIVHTMSEEVKQRIKNLGQSLIETNVDLKHIAEMAEAVREKGKRVALVIEEASTLSREIRETAEKFKRKIETS